MTVPRDLTFKIADTEDELEQVKRLNYETFVEEIPQHQQRQERSLTDRFHHQNTYFICKDGNQVVGMVAARANRPFSLDAKLPNLDSHLPPCRSVCEIRLLAVRRKYRHTRTISGLLAMVCSYCEDKGHDLAIISGAVSQQRLYTHLGFLPFGPVVGTSEAPYQPMYLTVATYRQVLKSVLRESMPEIMGREVNLLPGPVHIAREVHEALANLTISHRSPEYLDLHRQTCARLCQFAGSRYVEIGLGTGTLANDMVGGQLSLLPGRGLVLSNGEFGDRLIDHATRFGMTFDSVQVEWGRPLDEAAVRRGLDAQRDLSWVWAVHCETSTGVLNDLEMLKRLCAERGVRLSLDCISSIGTVRVNLAGVYLASGVSGKALGGFSGLALVFHNHEFPASDGRKVPRYLDLRTYAEHDGVPFSMSSNLLNALHAAAHRIDLDRRVSDLERISVWLRARLRAIGLPPLAPDACASPAVVTIPLPAGLSSRDVGRRLADDGYLLSYGSGYLLRRNWIQICLMRDATQEILEPVVRRLAEIASSPERP